MRSIRRAVPDDAHTYWDMTIASYWAWNTWDAKHGAFHSAQGAGGIGYAFPSALGGAVGLQQRVLAVSGDGSAMYSIAELAAAKQHNLPVTWLIIDDGGYGILREYMRDAFGQAVGTELARPDFVALAQSFGVSATLTDPVSLADDLQAAWLATGPNVLVLPTTLKMWAPTHKSCPVAAGVARAADTQNRHDVDMTTSIRLGGETYFSIDIKTLFATKADRMIRKVGKRSMPKKLLSKHTTMPWMMRGSRPTCWSTCCIGILPFKAMQHLPAQRCIAIMLCKRRSL